MELLPVAGLANRLRAIASAICGAEDMGRPLTVAWIQEYRIFRGRPEQLFDVKALPFTLVDSGFGGPPPYPYRECLSPSDWEKYKEKDPYKPIYIKSYGRFHQSDPARWVRALQSIRPSAILREALQSYFATLPVQTTQLIGVHIRRTDNRKAIQFSPTEAFLTTMRAYPADTHFYLATDDPLERDLIRQAFPGRIHTGATNLNRATEEGGIHAFFDFLCLARCSEIIGSAGSSFSECAAFYGGRPLHIVHVNALSS